MSPDRLKAIDLDKIVLRDDVVKRAVNPGAVSDLMDSIKISGLHTPIRVRPVSKYSSGVRSEVWELIAGRHRVEAARQLGWTEIDANVVDIDDTRAEMGMIDENLRRKDLEPAELVYATDRRKELYELLFPSTAHGGDRKSSRNNCDLNENEPERFTLNTAKATGKSERAVQMNASIGKKLKKEALSLVGTSLNSITELDALAKLPPQERRSLMDRAIAGEKVSAKATKPKSPSKPKSASQEAPRLPPVTIDLTTPEIEAELIAVGEAAADAGFFPNAQAEPQGGVGGADAGTGSTGCHPATTPTDGRISHSIMETVAAAEAEARALAREKNNARTAARQAWSTFIGALTVLDADEQRELIDSLPRPELAAQLVAMSKAAA